MVMWVAGLCLAGATLYGDEQYGDFSYSSNSTNITITGYTGAGGHVEIPAAINSLPVTTIGDWTFSSCGSLMSVTIPDSVTTIGTSAFSSCGSLTSVTIGNSVTIIGGRAFDSCGSLRRVYFAGNAPGFGSDIFWNANQATVYYLPETTGWGTSFVGRPAVLWNPTFTGVAWNSETRRGLATVTGTTNIPVAVQACTNLSTGPWETLLITNLTAGVLDFQDPVSTNFTARFYRVVGP
jgi:hypothetical protein